MSQSQPIIRAEAIRLVELLNLGQFSVPWHQRYYDWSSEDVHALLQDIDDAVKANRDCYFLGAVILIENSSQQWEINDGQQRMVTISLACASLCRRFADEIKGSQREGIALRALFILSPNTPCALRDSENYTPRIIPPNNDLVQYRQMIRGNVMGANNTLTAAWKEIDTFFAGMSIEHLEKYFDFLVDRIEVACSWIPSHIDPNAVYETINSRGKSLDDFDKIRNYLYSNFNTASAAEKKQSMHDRLEQIRVLIPSVKKASEYLRCHLQCKFGFLHKHKARFYRDARANIIARKEKVSGSSASCPEDYVFSLAMDISSTKALELFRTISAASPDVNFISQFRSDSGTPRVSRHLGVFLRELRGYKVVQPLVFSILMRYLHESDRRVKKRIARIANKNMSRLATFVLRTAFVANKFEPSHFEEKFSDFSALIMSASDIPDSDFANFLRECDQSAYKVLDDSVFRQAMIERTMIGEAKVKQFLLGINADHRSDQKLLNERLCSVEHILPKSSKHWSGWRDFKGVDGREWVHRIGNLTLLARDDNKPGDKYNSSFAKKRASYRDSAIAMTRKVGECANWSPDAIDERQRKMAVRAVHVWKFVE